MVLKLVSTMCITFYHHFDFQMTSFLHLFDAFAAPGDFKLEAHELEP